MQLQGGLVHALYGLAVQDAARCWQCHDTQETNLQLLTETWALLVRCFNTGWAKQAAAVSYKVLHGILSGPWSCFDTASAVVNYDDRPRSSSSKFRLSAVWMVCCMWAQPVMG
jgi:hypothetical protein